MQLMIKASNHWVKNNMYSCFRFALPLFTFAVLSINPIYAALIIDSSGDIWDLNIDTNTSTFIGRSGETIYDIALNPTSGLLYGVSLHSLYSIDKSNGEVSIISSHLSGSVNGLAFNGAGRLYGSSSRGDLFTLDHTTGIASLVGHTGFNSSGDLAFDTNDNLFMSADVGVNRSDLLISVNPNTGAGTLIGDIGFDNVYGLSFSDSILYGFTEARETIMINTISGAGSLLANNEVAAYGAARINILGSPTNLEDAAALYNANVLFDFAEREAPEYFSPSSMETQTDVEGWVYRYYPVTDTYVAVNLQAGGVYVLGGLFGNTVVYIDQLSVLLDQVLTRPLATDFKWPIDPINSTSGHYGPCGDNDGPQGCYWISDDSNDASSNWRDSQPYQRFINDDNDKYHLGADYNMLGDDNGKFVYPTAGGYLELALENVCGFGNIIFITHETSSGTITSMYAHVEWIGNTPPEIGPVNPYEPIAIVGDGSWECGPDSRGSYPHHLHFEIRDRHDLTVAPAYSSEQLTIGPQGQIDPNKFIVEY